MVAFVAPIGVVALALAAKKEVGVCAVRPAIRYSFTCKSGQERVTTIYALDRIDQRRERGSNGDGSS